MGRRDRQESGKSLKTQGHAMALCAGLGQPEAQGGERVEEEQLAVLCLEAVALAVHHLGWCCFLLFPV